MNNLVDVVKLGSLLKTHGLQDKALDFETLYSNLASNSEYDEVLYEVEDRIFRYLRGLSLPDEPTLYDHMLLCLRSKDVVASFNWDPLLPQALHRVASRIGQEHLPHVYFLHGNVDIGYCHAHTPPTLGFMGNRCGKCGNYLARGKILFPVTSKDYTDDPAISRSWKALKEALAPGGALIFTVFGYSASGSDVQAVNLLRKAWPPPSNREFEQTEIIDIRNPEELYGSWSPMICREHYWVMNEFRQSLAARHARRSVESFWEAVAQNSPREERPLPQNASWEKLVTWVTPLLEEERNAGSG